MLAVTETDINWQVIPNCPGVYLFYDSLDGLPIYIGKSINIRKRIQSHIYQAKCDPKELKIINKLNYIDWQTTVGEVGALLLEASLIKAHFPLYNRRLRCAKYLYSYALQSVGGFLHAKLVKHQCTDYKTNGNAYGLFRNRKQAELCLDKIVTEYQLCRKCLGLEKTQQACFAYQIGRCRGGCIGQESAKTHNARLIAALDLYQQRRWPYPVAMIGLVEEDALGAKAIHLIEYWRYCGTVSSRTDIWLYLAKHAGSPDFDIDHYKILVDALYTKQLSCMLIQPENKSILLLQSVESPFNA